MIHSRRVTALVPIKEHSERVPGKNFREFAGKPLYHHIVATLDRTYAVDEIVINTDSAKVILDAPKLSAKVRVMERPEDIRGDDVSMNRVIEYDLSQTNGDIYLQTHATNPLLRSETIAAALKMFTTLKPGMQLGAQDAGIRECVFDLIEVIDHCLQEPVVLIASICFQLQVYINAFDDCL